MNQKCMNSNRNASLVRRGCAVRPWLMDVGRRRFPIQLCCGFDGFARPLSCLPREQLPWKAGRADDHLVRDDDHLLHVHRGDRDWSPPRFPRKVRTFLHSARGEVSFISRVIGTAGACFGFREPWYNRFLVVHTACLVCQDAPGRLMVYVGVLAGRDASCRAQR